MGFSGREPGRRAGRGWTNLLIGVLVFAIVLASVLLVLNDTWQWLSNLAVVAALWVAILAAILVTKYRRQSDFADAKARDLRLVYELQLEREISARREYELLVEKDIRREVREESSAELEELKRELESLRRSLVELMGELPERSRALGRVETPELSAGTSRRFDALRADEQVQAERVRADRVRAGDRAQADHTRPDRDEAARLERAREDRTREELAREQLARSEQARADAHRREGAEQPRREQHSREQAQQPSSRGEQSTPPGFVTFSQFMTDGAKAAQDFDNTTDVAFTETRNIPRAVRGQGDGPIRPEPVSGSFSGPVKRIPSQPAEPKPAVPRPDGGRRVRRDDPPAEGVQPSAVENARPVGWGSPELSPEGIEAEPGTDEAGKPGAHASGRSVAELMEQMRSATTPGGRRRRKDD